MADIVGDRVGDSEVDEHGTGMILAYKDVRGLHVAVHDRSVVRVVQCVGDLFQSGKAFGRRVHVGDAAAGEQFHRQPPGAALVHRHDVGVREAAGEGELAPEPRDVCGVAVVVVEDLQCHVAIHIRVVGPVHRRVSAVADRFVDDVTFKLLAGREHVLSVGVCAATSTCSDGTLRTRHSDSVPLVSNGSTASEWVPTGSVTVRVPGKVNLYLEVGDRRDDGYHELTTVFHAVSLLDEITVRNADVLSLELAGEGVDTLPADERNLAWRAAEVLAEHVGRAPDVAILVEKSIPVAGGMAGGSADAAAVLVAMNTLWELGVPRRDLHVLAAQLGSDVPFALHGGTALGTGRGEELATVLARNTFHWVLAFAEGGLSTPAVFAEIDRLRAAEDRDAPPRLEDPEPVLAALASGDPAQLAPLLGNDLQPAALSLAPDLRRTLRAGTDAGALAGVISGSGPTCAFLCSSASAAVDVASEMAGAGVCRTVRVASGPVQGARVVPTPSASV